MAEGAPVRAFSIAPSRPFADDLAAGLIARFPGQLALARVLLLLPTRRSVRALTEAFVRESAGAALLLPRMVAIADLDSEAAGWAAAGALLAPLLPDSPPATSPFARRLALAAILARARHLGAAEAMTLAGQLGQALDTLEIEGRRVGEIAAAVPEGLLQQHWLHNAEILRVIGDHWPGVLADRGLMESTRRRNLQLAALAGRWQVAPPAGPVVMAGFAAAPPAVERLAAAVVRLRQGWLVLPGLDRQLDAATLACLRPTDERPGLETHPQHGMVHLLDSAGIAIAEVADWGVHSARPGSSPRRARLVADALRPAAAGWVAPAVDGGAAAGLVMLEAAGPAEEALAVALAMRQMVAHPGLTAALVTPDRALARRVRVQLQRFGITIDDSAGEPLAATGPGSLLLALAVLAGENFAPVPLLGALQHPLVRNGAARLGWLNQLRALDRIALRGVRPGRGLDGIGQRLRRSRQAPPDLAEWWAAEVQPLLAPLAQAPSEAQSLLAVLRAVAVALAGDALWAGEAGRALAALFEDAEESAADLGATMVAREDMAAWVVALMAGRVVRPRASRHPQLHIWGPLEARLQSADLMILGGLNETSWPAPQAPDPFLAPAIRRALHLPGLERRIGLQAHDFAAALGAGEVLLTRSVRSGGAPTVASRFWQRLVAALGALPDAGHLLPGRAALLGAARALTQPPRLPPIARPAPAPPMAARPKQLTVTDVAMLKADPFSFYAKRVLRLAPLEPRDAEPTAGDRGQIVHEILRQLLDGGDLRPETVAAVIAGETAAVADRPEIAALWQPRVARMVDWALGQLAVDDGWTPFVWEREAVLELGGAALRGRIDRLDRGADGLRVVDYKTGRVPAVGEVESLYQTQLALLGLMAEAGLFGAVAGARVTDLEYWKLAGGREPGQVRAALGKHAQKDADAVPRHLAAARADLQALVRGYLLGVRPFESKLKMVFGRNFRDYDHLARVAEWLNQ